MTMLVEVEVVVRIIVTVVALPTELLEARSPPKAATVIVPAVTQNAKGGAARVSGVAIR